ALEPNRTVKLIIQVLDSLAEAHAQGVVHRDIKPSNLHVEIVSGREFVRVLDFGIAKLFAEKHTITGELLGTPGYMSPEQVSGDDVGVASDLFAVGVVMYECLTGRRPFDGSLSKRLVSTLNDRPNPLRQLDPTLDALVMRMLEKDPAKRPASAEEVR